MNALERNSLQVLQEVTFTRRDGLSLEVEVLRLEELLQPPFSEKTTRPTRSRFHTLLLIEGGDSSHTVDFVRYSVGAGHLFVIPEGSVHSFARERVIQGYMALFTADFLNRCRLKVARLEESSELLFRSGMRLRLSATSLTQVVSNFRTLANHTSSVALERFASDAIASAFSLLVFSIAGIRETAAAVAAQVSNDELVARFLELLEAHFRVQHQAFYYARALGVSLRTLDRRLMVGQQKTTRRAISERLVLEAKRMLTWHDMSIKSIAYELGFSEPQNFTRFFGAKTGMSPQAFRASL